MVAYRALLGQTGPSGDALNDGQAIANGLEFYVTQSGCTLTQIHVWTPTGNHGIQDRTFALYTVTSGAAGTKVAGDFTITQPYAVNGWNTFTLTTPFALTANTRYRAVTHNAGGYYVATGGYWVGGGPGASGITNGPLVVPNATNATGGEQSQYLYTAGMAFPTEYFNGGNYWVDVTVDLSVIPPLTVLAATSTGTLVGSSEQAAISDEDDATLVRLGVGQGLDCTLRAIEKPATDFVATVRAATQNGGTLTATLVHGGTTLATVSGVAPGGSVADTVVTFPAASIDTEVTEAQWRSGALHLVLTA